MNAILPESPDTQVAGTPATPWTWTESLSTVAFSFVVYIIGSLVLLGLIVSIGGRRFYDKNQLVLNVAAYQILAASVVLSVLWLLRRRVRHGISVLGYKAIPWKTLLSSVAVVPLVLIAANALKVLFDFLIPGYGVQGNAQELAAGGNRHISPLIEGFVFLWAAVEAPLVEETLFRGILFQGLRTSLAKRLTTPFSVCAAACTSGLLFGLAHFQLHTLPILVLLGIALAYVFQVTRSIYASVLVHGLINALAVLSVFNAP